MLAIIICCCQKYISQYEKIYKSWKEVEKNFNVKLYFLFGSTKTYYENNTNKLFLNVQDNYESLPKKIYLAIEYILNIDNITTIFKTDDDIEFDKVTVISEILNLSKSINYCGFTIEHAKNSGIIKSDRIQKFERTNNKNYEYQAAKYCYGAGYYLSEKSITVLLNNKEIMYDNYLEDNTIGHILNKEKIYPTRLNSKYAEVSRF